MAEKNTAVVSDFHWGSKCSNDTDRKMFKEFMHYARCECDRLIVLGDAFDIAASGSFDRIVLSRGGMDMVKTVNEAAKDLKVIFIEGNHDSNVPKLFNRVFPKTSLVKHRMQNVIVRKRLAKDTAEPKEIYRMPYAGLEIKLGMAGKRALLCHGHNWDHYFVSGDYERYNWLVRLKNNIHEVYGQDPEALAYQWKKFIMKLAGNSGSVNIPGDIAIPQLRLAARDLALYEIVDAMYKIFNDGEEKIIKVPEIKKRSRPLDYIFFGHTHFPGVWNICDDVLNESEPTGSLYINTGYCMTLPRNGISQLYFTLLHPSDGRAETYEWGQFSKGKRSFVF
jgi:predicted phosphodiesterase